MIYIVYQSAKSICRCLGQTDVNAAGECPRNLTRLGANGMVDTDRMVLEIMTHKE